MLKVPGLKRYAKNTSWMFLERFLRVLVVFAVGIPVTRYLGDEQFGMLNYAAGWVGLFLSMSTLGLDEIIVRDLVRDESKRDELLGTSFVLRTIGGVLMVFVVTVWAWVKGNDQATLYMILLYSLAEIFRSSYVVKNFYEARVEARKTASVQLLQVLLSASLKIGLVLMEADLLWFAGIMLVESTKNGQFPKSKKELYENATDVLLREHNKQHQHKELFFYSV